MVASQIYEDPNTSYVRINTNSTAGKESKDDDKSIRAYITKGLSPSDKSVINAQLLHKSLVEQPPAAPRTEVHGEITSVVDGTNARIKVSIKKDSQKERVRWEIIYKRTFEKDKGNSRIQFIYK